MRLRLRDLRENSNLRQQDLADVLHCKQQTYSRYETGETQPSLDVLVELSIFYNTSVDYIMGLTINKKPYERTK